MANIFQRAGRGVSRRAGNLTDQAGNLGQDTWGSGKDIVRDVPVIGPALGLTSTEEQAANAKEDAARNALQYQQQMYQQAQGYLTPYLAGSAQNLQNLQTGIDTGAYSAPAYDYQQQTIPKFDYEPIDPQFEYSGSQLSKVAYDGQPVSQIGYSGQPESRSIQSFMGDMQENPAYQYQMDQTQKAIDRASAAGGRWGGGGTAQEMTRQMSGLAAQSYGDMWNRAQQEQGIQSGAEQQQYNRAYTGADFARSGEQQLYNRALTNAGMFNQADQIGYGRASDQYNRQLNQDQIGYGRATDRYGRELSQEESDYQRYMQQLGLTTQNNQNRLNQQMGLVNLGLNTSQSLANAATGQGSQLANIAIEQGNAAAQAKMASGNQLQKAIDMGKGVVDLYSSTQKVGK